MLQTPVLFIIFNRPDTTATVFEKIRQMKPAKLYVAADGARAGKAGEEELCRKTRAIIDTVDWPCEVKKLYRTANLGCGKAVSGAINWLFENEETGIILEDDCLPNDSFFTFCDTLLHKYGNDERVMMISGTNYIFEDISQQADYYLCRYYSVWGWATWRRAWQLYDFEMKSWPRLKAERYLEYTLNNNRMAEIYTEMFNAIDQKQIDTWDLQWAYACLANGGLCATASTNLIKNIGAVGTHTAENETAPYLKMPVVKEIVYKKLDENIPVSLSHIFEAKAFDSLISNFFGAGNVAQKRTLRSLAGGVYRKIKQRLLPATEANNASREVVTIAPTGKITGRALLSYLNEGIDADENSAIFEGHSNKWESRMMAQILKDMGYIVDVINWNNNTFIPAVKYDVLIDIALNLQRVAPYLPQDCIKILHNTGSYWYFANAAELKRVEDFEKRRHAFYTPKRLAHFPELHERSLKIADYCSLIGNQTTLETYPEPYRHKFTKVNVSNSKIDFIKTPSAFVPAEKEFLWFNSFGMVHKGLDLLLEVFLKHPEWQLHIIGSDEQDFMKAYAEDLKNITNISFHGFMNPKSEAFENIISKCFCFLSPSCSEGMSGSNATCLQIGMLPVISVNSGIDLAKNCGVLLQECSIPEIENAIQLVLAKTDGALSAEITTLQQNAAAAFSRDTFKATYTQFIKTALKQHKN